MRKLRLYKLGGELFHVSYLFCCLMCFNVCNSRVHSPDKNVSKCIIVCSRDHSSLKLHFIAAASLYFSAVPSLPTQDKTYKNASNAHFVLLRLERMMASLNRDFNQD